MYVISSVQKTTGCYGHISHIVPVEREFKRQLDSLKYEKSFTHHQNVSAKSVYSHRSSSVRVRKHIVDLNVFPVVHIDPLLLSRLLAYDKRTVVILVVVFACC